MLDDRSLALLLAGILIAIVGYWIVMRMLAYKIYQSIRPSTSYPNLERFTWPVSVEVARYFGTSDNAVEIAKVIMAIIQKETRGNPPPQIGDTNSSGGPSVGPMQVYRQSAIDYGLYGPRANAPEAEDQARYATLANDEDWGIKAGVAVFKAKFDEVKGDLNKAVVRYNGSGSAAEAYAQSVWSEKGEIFG